MHILRILAVLLALSVCGFAQVLPTFTITPNDVLQSSILVFQKRSQPSFITGEDRFGLLHFEYTGAVKFAFTETGAKRLEEFYRSHPAGQEVRYSIGRFERVFQLDDRKHFGREGFHGLTESEAKALEDGVRGRK